MPINKSLLAKYRRQCADDVAAINALSGQNVKPPKLYRVKSKFDGAILPTPVTLEEFAISFGAASRGYSLEPLNNQT